MKVLYAFLNSPMNGVCPAHMIHFDLITLKNICLGKQTWSPSLCNFFYPLVTPPLGLSTVLSTLLSNTIFLWQLMFYIHIKHVKLHSPFIPLKCMLYQMIYYYRQPGWFMQ
jgi:hypothetical protein